MLLDSRVSWRRSTKITMPSVKTIHAYLSSGGIYKRNGCASCQRKVALRPVTKS